jgi:hypothetical protein
MLPGISNVTIRLGISNVTIYSPGISNVTIDQVSVYNSSSHSDSFYFSLACAPTFTNITTFKPQALNTFLLNIHFLHIAAYISSAHTGPRTI